MISIFLFFLNCLYSCTYLSDQKMQSEKKDDFFVLKKMLRFICQPFQFLYRSFSSQNYASVETDDKRNCEEWKYTLQMRN